jgi:spermidine synthase
VAAAWIDRMGANLWAAVSVEGVLALAAFGLPTIATGALFSHLSARAAAASVDFGRALGANTLGAALAPLVFGVLVAPAIGPKATLLLVCAGYAALVAPRRWTSPWAWAPAAAAAALAVAAPPLFFVDVPEGGHLVSYRDGVLAAVSVVDDEQGVSRLRINNRQQEGSSATGLVDGRQALLPLLLHPAPVRALFLGLGTGVTASSAALDATLQVDAVELSPEVVQASAHFTRAFDDGVPNPRLHLMVADARRYVRATTARYDVIVADNYQPARSGSAALYTTEHFAAVRERLRAHGLFCQWLPLHQMDLATMRSIVRSFLAVYPGASAVLASNSLQTPVVGLIGLRDDDGRFDMNAVRGRLARNAIAGGVARYGFDDAFAVLGGFIAGPAALERFAGAAALNTDDRPVVAYLAPRMTYAPDSLPSDRLVALLQAVSLEPREWMASSSTEPDMTRLARYGAARNAFILAGRGVRPSGDARAMLAQVREPLLSVLRTSPDFRPAYDPLLQMATRLGPADAAQARSLLQELAAIQPERAEAWAALGASTAR